MGTPKPPACASPTSQGGQCWGARGEASGSFQWAPRGLQKTPAQPVNPEPLIPASPVGVALPGPFLSNSAASPPLPTPHPRPGGWQGLTVSTAQPAGLGDFSKIRNAKQRPVLGPKLSSKLWGDLGMQIKVVTKETASERPGRVCPASEPLRP